MQVINKYKTFIMIQCYIITYKTFTMITFLHNYKTVLR